MLLYQYLFSCVSYWYASASWVYVVAVWPLLSPLEVAMQCICAKISRTKRWPLGYIGRYGIPSCKDRLSHPWRRSIRVQWLLATQASVADTLRWVSVSSCTDLKLYRIPLIGNMFAECYTCIYLSIYRSIYLPAYLCIYVTIYLSTYLSIYLCIYLFIYLSIYLSLWNL